MLVYKEIVIKVIVFSSGDNIRKQRNCNKSHSIL
jgi:hypothetical protein